MKFQKFHKFLVTNNTLNLKPSKNISNNNSLLKFHSVMHEENCYVIKDYYYHFHEKQIREIKTFENICKHLISIKSFLLPLHNFLFYVNV